MLVSNTPIQLDIVSAEASIYSGKALMVTIMGSMGEMGIVHGHAPLLTALKPGQVKIKISQDKEESIYVDGGLVEIQPHVTTILADTAIRAADLDEHAALAAKERAEEMLELRKSDFDYSVAAKELAQAVAQLKAIKDLKKKARIK